MINTILTITDDLDLWKINRSGPKIEKWIKMEGFYLNSFVVLITIVSYVSALTHAIPLDKDEDIFYPNGDKVKN
jgi:hypothetical protein